MSNARQSLAKSYGTTYRRQQERTRITYDCGLIAMFGRPGNDIVAFGFEYLNDPLQGAGNWGSRRRDADVPKDSDFKLERQIYSSIGGSLGLSDLASMAEGERRLPSIV
jgi:hypothetical protein